MRMASARASALAVMLLLMPVTAAEAQRPLPELSLEELMDLDAGRVFGASARVQPVTEAPASVSFITKAPYLLFPSTGKIIWVWLFSVDAHAATPTGGAFTTAAFP